MARVIIAGIIGLEGEWQFDLRSQPFTTAEWEIIIEKSTYMPLTLEKGLVGGDPRVACAVATIALIRNRAAERHQWSEVYERLADVAFDGEKIIVDLRSAEEIAADAEGKDEAPEAEELGTSLEIVSDNANSGDNSSITSERSELLPSPTGDPSSDSAPSDLATSAT